MLKFQIPSLSILCFVSSMAFADDDLYELPMSVYTPPKENLDAPLTGQIPKMKSGQELESPRKKMKKTTFKSLEDITPEMVDAFKADLVEKVLKRNTFEVGLLGEKNLKSLPPLWVFGSEFSSGDKPELIARKIARLAMSATNDDLFGIDTRERRRLISDLYLRAGHIMHMAAEEAENVKVKQDHYLSAAQYFKWASVRMDYADQKREASQLVKRDALLSVQYAKMRG